MTDWIKMLYIRLLTSVQSLKDQKGQGLVEYALILVLIAVVVIAIMTTLGAKTNNVFKNVSDAINK